MKKQISLLLTFFAMAIMVHAQAPNAIPYQGVARNSSGSILASQAIRLRLTIRDVTAGGTIVYQETQAVNTSTLGLFNVNIGQGTIVTGTLAGVNWGGGAKFLQVEMDPTGGTNYISMGTTQLNSVPYALFAGSIPTGAGWSLTGNAGTVDGTSFVGTTDFIPFNIRVNNLQAARIDPTLQNTFFGYRSGIANTTGSNSASNGNYSLFTNTSGAYNLANGNVSLYSNTTGSYNVANGYAALYTNSTGGYNLANGANSLRLNTTGSYNVANGFAALYNNSTGSFNMANGSYSLYNNTTGSYNIATGANSLTNNTTGIYNIATGYAALYSNTVGNYNLATGYSALYNNTTGTQNTATGYQALYSNLAASNLTAVGFRSLYSNTTGANNSAYGVNSLISNNAGSYNTANGYISLYSNTTGGYNSAHGDSSLYSNTTGSLNTAIGYAALSANTTGSNNTAVGDSANVASGSLNNATAIGYKAIAPASNTIQLGNTTIDSVMAGTLSANTKLVVPRLKITGGTLGANNILTSDALGNATWQPSSLSGWSLTGNAGTVDGINFIGTTDNIPFNIRMNNQKAGRIDSSLRTTFYGYQSGGSTTTGGYNTANGYKSLFSNTTGAYNTAHGYKSLYSNTTGANNTANGDSALYSTTSGGFNTAHGYAALASNTTGSNNTAIGDSADVTTGALTNATAIGYNAKVSVSNTIQLGNAATDSVMAGSAADSTKLIIPRLRVTGGTPVAGQVLTATDALGNASWKPTGLAPGTVAGQMLYWNGTKWDTVSAANATRGQTLTFCQGGKPTWGACPAITATVITATPVTSITSTTATAGGNVTYDGDALITTSGVVYSTTNTTPSGSPGSLGVNYTVTTDGISNQASGSWSSNLTGLTYATTYYVWAYATNSIGTAYGSAVTFITLGVNPTVTTATTPTTIGSTTASIGGTIVNNGGATVSPSGIVYSTSPIPNTGTPPTGTFTTDGTATGSWTSSLTGLTPGTTYNYRAYATNNGGTGYGTQYSFTTTTIPTLTTVAPTLVGSTTANPGGNISANGGAAVSASGVIYSTTNTTPSLGSPYTVSATGNTSSWASSLTGLTPGTIYYAYAYATNAAGTAFGSQVTFTTTTVPTVTATATISNITATSATGGGTITATGGAAITTSGVVWSTSNTAPSGSPGSLVGFGVSTDGPTTTGSWSNSSLTGLTAATKYYVYAYATNNVGTTYGPQVSFTTTISVGNTYQGGKVFYLLQSGDPGYNANVQHGLIAATADQSTSATWYNGSYTSTGATATALGTGAANTAAIITSQGAGTYAATICTAYNGGGFSDWYLPSQFELNLLYGQKAAVGGFTASYYWSSSEDNINNNNAWIEGFLTGNQLSTDKNTPANVRPIRSF